MQRPVLQTEALMVVANYPVTEIRPGAMGLPLPGLPIEVISETDLSPLPAGEVGARELGLACVRADQVRPLAPATKRQLDRGRRREHLQAIAPRPRTRDERGLEPVGRGAVALQRVGRIDEEAPELARGAAVG